MQAPIQSTNERDQLMTAYLYQALRQLPYDIEGLEVIGVKLADDKRQVEVAIEDAELNALLNNPNEGKNEAARKLIDKTTLQKDVAYQKARKELIELEGEIETNEVNAKAKRREFQAALALAELHAARCNMIAKIQTNNKAQQ